MLRLTAEREKSSILFSLRRFSFARLSFGGDELTRTYHYVGQKGGAEAGGILWQEPVHDEQIQDR